MRNDRLGLLAGLYSAARESAMAEPDSYSEDGMNRILLQLRAEAEQPADVPELHIVVAMDDIRFQIHLLAVYIEGLGAWGCSEGNHPRRRGPHQCCAYQGTCQYRRNKLFPFHTVDLLLSSAVLVFLTATTYRKSGEKSTAKSSSLWRK